jgi:hypothetical protein
MISLCIQIRHYVPSCDRVDQPFYCMFALLTAPSTPEFYSRSAFRAVNVL